MNDPVQTQRDRNQATRESGRADAHVANVMQHILNGRRGGEDRLCVFGAGNCNDIRMDELSAAFAEVHLVDVDGDSLAHATQSKPANVRLHDVDLSGWYTAVAGVDSAAAFDAIQSTTNSYQPEVPESPFDVVVSTCLLSQIIDAAIAVAGRDHPQLLDLIFAIRRQHVFAMLAAMGVGARGVLITDFVSSDTLPNLTDIPESEFANAMRSAIEAGNFFTGLNPTAILHSLRSDAVFVDSVQHPRLTLPWAWQLGPRAYGVAAILFER